MHDESEKKKIRKIMLTHSAMASKTKTEFDRLFGQKAKKFWARV